MVDIHTHILPALDDGSESMEMSLHMARQALASGNKHLATTSHCNIYPYSIDEYWETFDSFKSALQENNIPLKIYSGQELMLNDRGLRLLMNGQALTINNTRYVLVEFDFEENPEKMCHLLNQVRRLHYIPIVAHPERYYALQDDPSIAEEFCMMGCVLQGNGGSLIGDFGRTVKRTSEYLLNHGNIHVLATDAHEDLYRTTNTTGLMQWLEQRYSPNQIKLWTSENPSRIIKGSQILILKQEKNEVWE